MRAYRNFLCSILFSLALDGMCQIVIKGIQIIIGLLKIAMGLNRYRFLESKYKIYSVLLDTARIYF